jgi:hypothetical protein
VNTSQQGSSDWGKYLTGNFEANGAMKGEDEVDPKLKLGFEAIGKLFGEVGAVSMYMLL